jgi:hypothetical protein
MPHDATSPECDDRSQPESEDELVWGARAIAKVINRKPRAVFHLAAKKKKGGEAGLPVEYVGGRLVARKSKSAEDRGVTSRPGVCRRAPERHRTVGDQGG